MTVEIPLTQGYVALVDDADAERVRQSGPWHVFVPPRSHTAYALHSVSARKKIRLHHFLTGWRLVDHINGDGLDNRRANLRSADQSLNSANRRMPSSNTSGFKGVTRLPSGRWQAQITVRGAAKKLGAYDSREEAARAYDAAAIASFGLFARPNFPIRKDLSA